MITVVDIIDIIINIIHILLLLYYYFCCGFYCYHLRCRRCKRYTLLLFSLKYF